MKKLLILIVLSIFQISTSAMAQGISPDDLYKRTTDAANKKLFFKHQLDAVEQKAKIAAALSKIKDSGYLINTKGELVRLPDPISKKSVKSSSPNRSNGMFLGGENRVFPPDFGDDIILSDTVADSGDSVIAKSVVAVSVIDQALEERMPDLKGIYGDRAEFYSSSAVVTRKVGQSIGGYKVVKITLDSVFISNDEDQYTLSVDF